jgi:hypothetical protein
LSGFASHNILKRRPDFDDPETIQRQMRQSFRIREQEAGEIGHGSETRRAPACAYWAESDPRCFHFPQSARE